MAQWQKIHLPMQETQAQSLGQEDPLEKEVTMHSNIFACKIPGTRNPATVYGAAKSQIQLSNYTAIITTVQKYQSLPFLVTRELCSHQPQARVPALWVPAPWVPVPWVPAPWDGKGTH